MNPSAKQTIRLEINALKNLPALPEASLRILEAINTPDVPIDKLANALSLSPGLVARLLGLANSAYFARGNTVSDIRTAIFQVLGLDLVKALALGIIFNVHFDTRKCEGFDTDYFWTRSLLTAIAAQKLAAESPNLKNVAPSAIYTAGLLLDVGVLILGYLMPEQMQRVLGESKKNSGAVGAEIVRQLEQSHFLFGYFLLQKWRLPQLYQSVLQQFGTHEPDDSAQPLITLLRICRSLSKMVADNQSMNPLEFEADAARLQLPMDAVLSLAEQLASRKSDMHLLAAIMGH